MNIEVNEKEIELIQIGLKESAALFQKLYIKYADYGLCPDAQKEAKNRERYQMCLELIERLGK